MVAEAKSLDKCHAYLNAQFGMSAAERAAQNRRYRRTAVTLSRLCGARARGVGECLAEMLEGAGGGGPWAVFDDELVRQVLKDHALPQRLAKFMPEDVPSLVDDALCELLGVHPSDWTMFQHTADTIYRLAAMGRVIIVGRGGNVITRHLPSVLHVRLVGCVDRRVAHMTKVMCCDEPKARAHVQKLDRARRRYVMAHFDRDIDDPLGYDLVLNTDNLSDREAARAIAGLVLKD